MQDAGLLGNETLRRRLEASFASGHAAHSYLIAGPQGSGRHTLARWLSAALCCAAEKPPCLRCESCRKALAGVHPDIFIVDSDKAILPVDTVRQACADAWVRPTEALRRVFIVPRAQAMNAQGQNALLKTIEEPPEHAAFLLLCENEAALLPTVRSRCALLHLSPLPQALLDAELARRCPEIDAQTRQTAARQSSGYLGQALALAAAPEQDKSLALAAAFAENTPLAALEAAYSLESLKREQLLPVLDSLLCILGDALLASAGQTPGSAAARAAAEKRTPRDIRSAIQGLRTLRLWCQGNVGPGHLAGDLSLLLYRPGKYQPDAD